MRGLLALLLCLAATPAAAETREISLPVREGAPLRAVLAKPEGEGPFPAVVALHGCGGLWTGAGRMRARETAWADRFVGAGWAVLFPDSFSTRGYRGICGLVDRPILPQRERVRDAFDALAWLQAQAFVRADRVALFGWSHGAMTALWTVAADRGAAAPDFAAAVAFYPGCAEIGRTAFRPRVPLLLELGGDDAWTPPTPCVAMAAAARARGGAEIAYDLYPGAVHGFDQPIGAVHEVVVRNSAYKTGEKTVKVGADPAARAIAVPRAMDWLHRNLDR
ncbi:Dienelactone hydrolase [uncultured Alphaproteobacteria bacterium]|uniref:Dienelactone hydrolase n=1 Tax=uncultured Alphaproteobacteria bacterium TaxID=91750 RepID=A0A212JF92_9PROT|nr:Dienelactone hydrolase [uncultured Alphaproteobacteria bacterium]